MALLYKTDNTVERVVLYFNPERTEKLIDSFNLLPYTFWEIHFGRLKYILYLHKESIRPRERETMNSRATEILMPELIPIGYAIHGNAFLADMSELVPVRL